MRNHSFLNADGWWNSVKTLASVDAAGAPIPWLTYPCIDLIRDRVGPCFRVFEYGSGSSTLWWAARVESLVSCEHDPDWYASTKALVPDNVDLVFRELADGQYCEEISNYEDRFDVVVIDGRDRVNCAKHCLPALKRNGVVIGDNSDRERYSEGLAFLQSAGFKRLDLWGNAPVAMTKSCTTIFYREGNCLNI